MKEKKKPGRPKIDPQALKIPVAFKLPRWLVKWMRAHEDPQSVIIEDAVIEKHGLKRPETEK